MRVLREAGHTVGFMGDGINDAPAMRAADVGISVDTAVDIAKESAGVILLEKDLTVVADGVVEGRKTYANMMKYIKITASSNFGNMLSVLIASAFLPFLPMLSVQIILLNLVYDVSCTSLPWDNVEGESLSRPAVWESRSILRFMFCFGPVSSLFDILDLCIAVFRPVPRSSRSAVCRRRCCGAGAVRGALSDGLVRRVDFHPVARSAYAARQKISVCAQPRVPACMRVHTRRHRAPGGGSVYARRGGVRAGSAARSLLRIIGGDRRRIHRFDDARQVPVCAEIRQPFIIVAAALRLKRGRRLRYFFIS